MDGMQSRWAIPRHTLMHVQVVCLYRLSSCVESVGRGGKAENSEEYLLLFFDIEVEFANEDLDSYHVAGMERYTGDINWLSACDGLAAFGAIDDIIILSLPPAQTITYLKPAKALCLPTASSIEVTCLLLAPDALSTIWGYKQQTFLSSLRNPVILRNAIRIVWFDARQQKVEEKDRAEAHSWTPTEIELEFEGFGGNEISDEEDDDEGSADEAWFEDILDVLDVAL